MRSLTKNQEAVAVILAVNEPAVMSLQETWLQKPVPNLHDEYDRFSSFPAKYEGVALFTRKEF